jgi:hypothetical protein
MGLFSSTKIYVSSVVYNLAGDENKRPNYLKSLVQGNILTDTNFDVSETLRSGYAKGPGIKLRNFFRWADTNYSYIGMPKGGSFSSFDVDGTALTAAITHPVGSTLTLQDVLVDGADVSQFATQWMLEHYPDLEATTAWTSDHDDATGEIVVTLEDTTVHRFMPVDYDRKQDYIYATYSISAPGTAGPVVSGTTVSLGSGSFPDTSAYALVSASTVGRSTSLSTVVTTDSTYSDGRTPDHNVTSSSTATPWDETHNVWSKDDYQGQDHTTNRTWSLRSIMNQDQSAHVVPVTTSSTSSVVISGGVTKTTTVTTVTDTLVFDRSYRIDTQDVTITSFIGPKMFIYRVGSGYPELDAAITKTTSTDQYYPFIPARLDNTFVDAEHFPDAYAHVKRAYNKATGQKYNKFIEKIADNEHLSDIDYTYVVFGVSANVKEQACRKYLYLYFKNLMDGQLYNSTDFEDWVSSNSSFQAVQLNWQSWKDAQSNPLSPKYGTPEPYRGRGASVPTNEVRISADGTGTENLNYDIRISWQTITEEFGTGVIDSTHKKGELWFTTAVGNTYTLGRMAQTLLVDDVTLNYQVTANTWKKLHIRGMVHRNYIYVGKFVEIGLSSAINDTDESGFILPLHSPTYHALPLVAATQMATACCFVVFNCYVTKKLKWYQTLAFQIIVIIVIIVISIYFPPASGLLGTNAAVGAAVGLTGTLAIIVGAIANFIAAAILLKIIEKASVALFGDKLGAIISAIVSFIAIAYGPGILNGTTNMASMVHSMSNISNIMSLTSSVGNGIAGYINAEAADINKQMDQFSKDAKSKASEVSDLYAANIGYDRGSFDAMNLTDYVPFTPENREAFLARTTMTGTDNIELQMAFISKLVDLTITNTLPL